MKVKIMVIIVVRHINILSAADLYIVLYNSIITNPAIGHGREGIYFGENGEYSFYELARAIGEALVAVGKTDNPEPTTFTKKELDGYFKVSNHSSFVLEQADHDSQGWAPFFGSNSRAVANRSRSIGWKPVKTTQDFLASIQPEVVACIQNSQ
jgi:hypothetical protein